MLRTSSLLLALSATIVNAAPAPVPNQSGQETSAGPTKIFTLPPHTVDSQIAAIPTTPPTWPNPGAAPPRRSSVVTGATSHGPFRGEATTLGAEQAPTTLAKEIAPVPVPTQTYYNPNGKLTGPMPIPHLPAGGRGLNGSLPRYMVASDFDFESVALGLYQEWIELDLFNNGLATFSEQDFLDAGLTAEDRALIAYMANQETGHATLLSNMLGQAAPPQCTYNYPYKTVREFIDYNIMMTRIGESGVWGFLSHLDSLEVSTLLVQAEAVEARQQANFRQMMGLHPQPFWFVPGVPQSWHWTVLAQYISECPQNTTRLAWQNFPNLHIVNQPNPNRYSPNDTAPWEVVGNRTADPSDSNIPAEENCLNVEEVGYNCKPAIHRNRTEPLSFPGREIFLTWDDPGMRVGPNNSYITETTAGAPAFVAWTSQLNVTFTPLNVTGPNSGSTYQPPNEVFQGDPAVNETVFLALTDSDLYVTPFNLTMLNPHIRALGLFKAG